VTFSTRSPLSSAY